MNFDNPEEDKVAENRLEIVDYMIPDLLGMLNPKHPKQISGAKKQQLQDSLKRFQQVIPLIINKRTNHIVSGHQTVLAASEVGFVRLSAVVIDISQEEETAYVIALKNVRGEWDEEKLAPLLLTLNSEQQAVTGLSKKEISQMLGANDYGLEVVAAQIEEANQIVKDLTKSIVTIKFGELTIRATQSEYNEWIMELIAAGDKTHTAQSIGRTLAKRIGVNHLVYN